MVSLKNNTLLRSSIIFFIGTVVAGFGNYLYQLFSARVLSVAEFGTLGSLLSLFTVLSVPAGALATVSTQTTAIFSSRGDFGAIRSFLFRLSKIFSLVSIGFFILFILAAPLVKRYFKLDSLAPYYILTSSVLFVFLAALWRGVLPGLKKFRELSIISIFESAGRFVLAVIFFFVLVRGINGIALAAPASSILAIVFLYWQLREIRSAPESDAKLNKFFSRFLFVLFWTLSLSLLQNVDVLFVKRFFSSEETGLYTAMNLLGKIVFFVNCSIVGVLFPLSSELYEKGEHVRHRRLMKQSLGCILGIGLAAVLGYWMFQNLVVNIFFGKSYLSFAPYLPWFGLLGVLLSVLQLFATYFLSVNGKHFLWVLALAAFFEAVLFYLFHEKITDMLAVLTAVFALLDGLLFFMFLFGKLSK